MLEVPLLAYTADPLARLIGLGWCSLGLPPAGLAGGAVGVGVWPAFGEESLL